MMYCFCHVFIKHYRGWDFHINYNCRNDWCSNLKTISVIIKLHYKITYVGGIVVWCFCNLLYLFNVLFSYINWIISSYRCKNEGKRTETYPLTEAVQMCIVNGNHFDILYLIPWCIYSNNFNGILKQNATLYSSLRMQVIDFKNYLSTETVGNEEMFYIMKS